MNSGIEGIEMMKYVLVLIPRDPPGFPREFPLIIKIHGGYG
jgi:hypothetical protein